MRSRTPGVLFLFFLAVVGVTGLYLQPPHRTGLQDRLTLVPVAFSEIPGWVQVNPIAALAAFRRSCSVVLNKAPNLTLGGYAGEAADWQPVCRRALNGDAARRFFETNFIPLRVNGEALFTGYYEPLLRGSRTRHGAYQTPVYALPRDLVSVDLGTFRAGWKGERIAGRVSGQHLVPYETRAGIDAKPPSADVLFYGDDPVAVFFLHIQGSGRVALDDGTILRVSYAGQNGRPYTAIGGTLIRSAALERKSVSMQTIRDWLKRRPEAAQRVMETDESFVFFRESPVSDASLGSVGTQGVALTPLASVAVDPNYHALGVPFFIDTTTPDGQTMQRLAVSQDTGSAIRGPARADIFFGFGAAAEEAAGKMKATGQLFVLLPKALAGRVAQ